MATDSAPDARVERLHTDACGRGIPGYIDPDSGLYVLCATYLQSRGFCCGNGCRHCPFVGTSAEHPERAASVRRRTR